MKRSKIEIVKAIYEQCVRKGYDSSLVEYVDAKHKITLMCPVHGNFEMYPHNFLKGHCCPKCSGNHNKTTEEFINECKEKYPDLNIKYDKVNYKNNTTEVTFICPIHGNFNRTPSMALKHLECEECQKERLHDRFAKTPQTYLLSIKTIFGNKLIYNKTAYVNNKTPITATCPIHGDFTRYPNDLLKGYGCPKCSRINAWDKRSEHRMTTGKFVQRCLDMNGDAYDYSNTIYVDSKTKVCIRCPKHGKFWQLPYAHLNGQGCPICKESKMEKEIADVLSNYNIAFYQQKSFEWLKLKKSLFLDFYLPKYHLAIECQGEQHFHPVNFFGGDETYSKQQKRDEDKFKLCEKHSIQLIYFTDTIYLKEGINRYGICFSNIDKLLKYINSNEID